MPSTLFNPWRSTSHRWPPKSLWRVLMHNVTYELFWRWVYRARAK